MMRDRACYILMLMLMLMLMLVLLSASCKQTIPAAAGIASNPARSTSVTGGSESTSAPQFLDTEASSSGISSARADEVVREVMNQEYGDRLDAKLGCWAYTAELANDSFDYCMKPGAPRLVMVKGTEHLYFYAASRADITDDPNYSYGQTDPGIMGAFRVEIESPTQWKLLAASKDLNYGSVGNCGCHDAQFVRLGADYYGWKFVSGGVWQGVASFSHNLVAQYRNEFKDISAIQNIREDDQSVEYVIKVDETTPSDRVYALLITRTKAGTTLDKTKVNFDYQKWQYALPIYETNVVENSRPTSIQAVAKTATAASRHTHGAISPRQTLNDGGDTRIQPEFRKLFNKCWQGANDTESKMKCIKIELTYHDSILNENYKALHRVLPDKEWLSLREDQRQWHPSTKKACRYYAGTAQQKLNSYYCTLYRTALRAYEFGIMLDLERNSQNKKKGELE